MKKNFIAFGLFFGKILLKLLSLKLFWAAASFVSYAYIFTWQFAIVLIGSIFFHELGHAWAAKQVGMKVKGIYLIPFVGGAAVIDNMPLPRWQEFFIAITGPIWGFALLFAMIIIYALTGIVFFAGVASWMALITLFNLLPINPLDGGRIIKSIAFSINNWVGWVIFSLGIIIATWLLIWQHIWLLVVVMIIGLLDLLFESQKGVRTPMTKIEVVCLTLFYLLFAGLLLFIMIKISSVPGAEVALKALTDSK